MGWRGRWLEFCRRIGAGGAAEEVFADLDRRYREPGRHYHTWAHVADCLRELRRARPAPREAAALELAVWFHDAVYDPARQDNEERSAALAARWASALGLPPALSRQASRLILATRHVGPDEPEGVANASAPGEPGEALLRDIDLAVLGGCWARFLRYERRIAREYSGLPRERFRAGRAELLRGFLRRPALYSTPEFRRRFERRARENLGRALARLQRAKPRPAQRPGYRPAPPRSDRPGAGPAP
jgi:predicted metal-dependent HD superfamily phosphohydrolase